jgi:hypothetical protein
MYYVICEYDQVREQFPQFENVMATLQADLISKATKKWTEDYGGVNPDSGQFGKSTIMPQLLNGLQTAYQPMSTWYQWLNATGHQTILTGAASGGTLYEDYLIGICGLAFLSKAIRISEIKMQISDRKLGRMNVEEAMMYNKPAIIFEEGYIWDEKTGLDLYAYVNTQGPQRIKLIGLQLNRVPNKMQVTNTGAALT